MKLAFVIYGQAYSKANSRKIVTIKGRPASIKSKNALAYERDALRQIPGTDRLRLSGPVRVTLRMFYKTQRPDLDESLVLDILQDRYSGKGENRVLVQRGVIQNDRQVREKHVFWGLDKKHPRVEIIVESIEWQQSDLVESEEAKPSSMTSAPPF